MLEFRPTDLPGVLLVATRWFEDDRGAFTETWNGQRWREAGVDVDFVQDNHVSSRRAGTLRGMHFQRPPMAQAKLVRVVRGAIWDVVIDLRAASPTYGRWMAAELSEANRLQVFIPVGFAHGYVSLTDDSEVFYKVGAPYSPAHEAGIAWDDPALGIPWPIKAEDVTIADRDRKLPKLAEMGAIF
jgi:dTDP-4-dehydrorhamnose 3,5-epimerase